MAFLLCPECFVRPESASLVKPTKSLYCNVCHAEIEGLHVKLPCTHTVCIEHYKMMGGEIDENQKAAAVSGSSSASKTAGLSSQAKRRAAKKDKESAKEEGGEASPPAKKTDTKPDTPGEQWFPTKKPEKDEKDGKIMDSTMRSVVFAMLICGLSNTLFGRMGITLENAPDKLMELPSLLQKSGVSMLQDLLTGEGQAFEPPTVTLNSGAAIEEGDFEHVPPAELAAETVHELAD
eukprot:TRINITY_DN11088_c0_g1_i1.p1 TRINITY_DN11088_c0_g1~~TRINITY_DN11088_c0_g1_i1.p1  ORF type:complete len:257 (+),score=49.26 TRINITY_DN11088_c0_g1_i1:67-771(+)